MHLVELRLMNFRNYARLEAQFSPGLIVLHGANAQGKTNFLEAVAYLATARSSHALAERELVHFGAREEGLPFAHVEGRVQRADGLHHVRITVALDEEGKGRTQKNITFDGQRTSLLEYIGEIAVVQFLPEDIGLIVSSPRVRRRYLDVTICQIDRQYCHDLARYAEAVRQRNAALRALQEQGGDPEVAWMWDAPPDPPRQLHYREASPDRGPVGRTDDTHPRRAHRRAGARAVALPAGFETWPASSPPTLPRPPTHSVGNSTRGSPRPWPTWPPSSAATYTGHAPRSCGGV
ncbi:MAG: AAA family ATPase [Ardenticatenia bacterium]|nr:AAA family ATPase [Ardenticatenia bacterium]